MNKTSELFDAMRSPTVGNMTDGFGAFRDFALPGQVDPDTKRPGWYPGCGYRPIHYGTDYSWRQGPQLFAPSAGRMLWIPGYQMIVFVPHVDGDPVHDAVIYLRHVRAGMGFDDQKWHTVSGSSIIGVSDTEHTRWPHLHVEIAVTVDAYLELVSDGTLTRKVVTVDFIGRRAMIRKMNPYDVSTAVNVQMDTDGILLIEEDAIFRQNLPGYKRTEFSYLGRDNVVIVNPEAVIGS